MLRHYFDLNDDEEPDDFFVIDDGFPLFRYRPRRTGRTRFNRHEPETFSEGYVARLESILRTLLSPVG